MLHLERHYRPSAKPLLRGPLCVRSAGHYRVMDGWREHLKGRPFTQLFWVVEGALRARTPDGTRRVAAREVLVYHPGEPHRLLAEGRTEYRWLTLDGWASHASLWGDGATRRSWRAGPCPADLFDALVSSLSEARPEAETAAARIGQEIHWIACSRLSSDAQPASGLAACLGAMEARFRDPSFDQAELARTAGRHRTTLFRQFLRSRGMTPAAYLRRLRVAEAIRLLRETRQPVSDVAVASGFRDPAYLARVVRAATGFSPSELRGGG